jgi:VWFA-related protein
MRAAAPVEALTSIPTFVKNFTRRMARQAPLDGRRAIGAGKSSVFNHFSRTCRLDGLPGCPYTRGTTMPTPSRRRILAAVAPALVLLLAAGSPVPLDAQARTRTVYVSAVGEDGEPVEGLGPEAFVVREDGVRREVLRVDTASEPIDLVLLVDNSTAASSAIPDMRESLTAFVQALGSEARLTLVGLADRPTVLVGYTSETPRVTQAIGRLFPLPQSGMTLLDAIAETSQGIARRPTARAAMVAVLTDGVEFTNRYARDVTERLRETRVPLHAITIGRFDLSDEHALRERGFLLENGTRESGGQWIRLLTQHALQETLQRLARELTTQYAVEYARPETLIPPERVAVTSARAGVRMRGAPARDDAGAPR